jgi:hypothetical protein
MQVSREEESLPVSRERQEQTPLDARKSDLSFVHVWRFVGSNHDETIAVLWQRKNKVAPIEMGSNELSPQFAFA